MCGIVGYVGPRSAVPILLDGLARLEYRGYDSAGLAVLNGHGVEVRKLAGRVQALRDLVAQSPIQGACGIGHTRWATHGAATDGNAHPHSDCSGTLALVHNGIIENADVLRARLEREGHTIRTETDTEMFLHLIEDAPGDTLEQRVFGALAHVEGTYGLAVISEAEPGKIVVARRGSPVLLGIGEGEYLIASDASAVLEHTRSVVHLDDGDVAVVTPEGYRVLDRDAHERTPNVDDVQWDLEEIALGGYEHFMLKEICDQHNTIQATLRGRLLRSGGTSRLDGLNLTEAQCDAIRRIVIVACGTSWHAGLVGRHVIEELAGIPVSVEYASEFRYRRLIDPGGTLTIAVSQSGETADTLEALRLAKSMGSDVAGVVNVVGSSIAREAGGGIYLHAGPEIGVASTKAFTSQIIAFLLLGLHLGRRRGLPLEAGRRIVAALEHLPELVARALELAPQVSDLADQFADANNALYLGRGLNYPVALEGALKLKEISYIHAEGYPAAEMKHGPIALIDEDMPEVRARGGRIVAITSEGSPDLRRIVGHQLFVPASLPLLSPLVTVIPLQLLAYYIAVRRGCDVDRPRNLAKSVTVE
jgi:glutamine---fructose-6-phosphate transaminase (isomerizing)